MSCWVLGRSFYGWVVGEPLGKWLVADGYLCRWLEWVGGYTGDCWGKRGGWRMIGAWLSV